MSLRVLICRWREGINGMRPRDMISELFLPLCFRKLRDSVGDRMEKG